MPGAGAFNLAMNGKIGDAAVSLTDDIGCAIGAMPGALVGAAVTAAGVATANPPVALGGAAIMVGGAAFGCSIGQQAFTDIANSLRNYLSGGTETQVDPAKLSPTNTPARSAAAAQAER